MPFRTRRQAGFTIIELSVGMLVLAIFLSGAFSMVVRNNQMARQNQAKLNATQAVRASADRIGPLLRQADRLLVDTAAIPADVTALCGSGFFGSRTTNETTLVLRSPVFRPDGTLTSHYSYTALHADPVARKLYATYVIMRPDGSVNYKRRDEVLNADWAQPKDHGGNALDAFTYFNASGAQVGSVSAANAAEIVRIRLSMAAEEAGTREKQWSQLTSEIRLANQATRRSIPFVVYNAHGSSRTVTNLDIVGPSTATLTRVDWGTVAVWTGTQALSATAQRLPVAVSPPPTITGTSTQPATLWFTPSGAYSGAYTVRFTTASNDTLASAFTN
jgi:prepilin-type N-terminal cleavage/methylation domain-containing protein